MEIKQTNRFKKAYKKLHSNQLGEVNDAIKEVIDNPTIGEQKKGNLSWLRVYKFKVIEQLTLLGYSLDETGENTPSLLIVHCKLCINQNGHSCPL